MEIDRVAFPAMLPTLLNRIARSHFVAFDLELSGIPVRLRRDPNDRQSLEERYLETKRAAEQFQILQVGLTCVEESQDEEKYILRSFNFNISPLAYEGLEIERNFTYSSGAVDFLLGHGYRMDAPFTTGVPYLKNEEVDIVKESARLKWDKAAIPDLIVRADDVKTHEFVIRVKNEIKAWEKTKKPDPHLYNVSGGSSGSGSASLSNFERRLVHQLVRAEFPNLSTYSAQGYVQIRKKRAAEQNHAKELLGRRIASAIFNQTGFTWIAKALASEDLSEIDISSCSRVIQGEPMYTDLESFTRRLDDLRAVLRNKSTILVGHNCFLDLVFFYSFFYGPLPDSLEEFQCAVQEKFPLVFDTKYMATSGTDGILFQNTQLWQLEERLRDEKTPTIEVVSDFDKEKYHEAGFDSLVTAKTFLRLACKLDKLSHIVEKEPHPQALDPELGQDEEESGGVSLGNLALSQTESPDSTPGAVIADVPKRRQRKKEKPKTKSAAVRGKFSHANRFDGLQSVAQEEGILPAETPASRSNPAWPQGEEALTNHLQRLHMDHVGETKRRGTAWKIPDWDCAFWQAYGNKLRVYGTMEEFCDLAEKRAHTKPTGLIERNHTLASDRQVKGEYAHRRGSSLWGSLETIVKAFAT